MPHVADDADDPDGCRSFQGWYPQLSADDVPATERVEGEVFVDDDNAFAVEPIVVVEEAAGAWVAGRVLFRLVDGMRATEPSTVAATMAILVAVAMVASYVPARRASRADAMTALRQE